MLNLRIKLVGGTLPVWKSTEDAGLDLHSSVDMVIKGGDRDLIPLGITTAFNSMYVGLLRDRSGLSKRGIFVSGGVVDSGYRGEWMACLTNNSGAAWNIKKGDRVCQVLFMPVIHLNIMEVQSLEESLRGDKGFGSSGR